MDDRLHTLALKAWRTWRLWIEPERLKMKRDVGAWSTLFPPGAVVVEVGAGTEFMKPTLEATVPGLRYFGGDISPTTNTRAVFDVCAVPLPSACADAVLALEVLEHLEAPDLAVAEMSRVLRPGGRLVVTVPFMFGVHDFRDYYRYTPLGLQTLVERHGLTVTEVRRRGGTFVASTGLVRNLILNSIVGRPRDWRAQGRDKKIRWLVATVVLTPWTPVTWLAYALDLLLDRESVSAPGLFFLVTKGSSASAAAAGDTADAAPAADADIDAGTSDAGTSDAGTSDAGTRPAADWARDLMRCPDDRNRLLDARADAGEAVLTCASCGRRYPVQDGVPILLLSAAVTAAA